MGKFKVILVMALILALGAVFLSGCQAVASPLEDIEWRLTEYGNPGNMKAVLPETQITAFFNSRTKELSGSSGCNHYGGAYQADHLTLNIPGPLAVTEMYCGEEQDTQEKAYLEILQKAERFEMDHGNLIIHSGMNRLVFKNTGSTVKPVEHIGE